MLSEISEIILILSTRRFIMVKISPLDEPEGSIIVSVFFEKREESPK